MTQSGKLINGGLALILISSSGCAGNGLRNMFSRNETAGYKTLEELEEERLAKEKSGDESSHRFASWLPFGRKTADETEALADAEESLEDSGEAKKSRWWRNPFRRQETIEADPFLENELPTEVVVAGKNEAKAKAEGVAATAKEKTDKVSRDVTAVKDRAVKTASATTASEDDLLVDKFEKHFQKSTDEATTTADEQAEKLLSGMDGTVSKANVAKKKTAASANEVNAAAEEKLAEFEELLAAKKAAASKARKDTAMKEEFEAAEDAAVDFAESVVEESRTAEKKTRSASKQAVASTDEFDSLFETDEKPVASKSRKKTSTNRVASSESKEVNVARAEDIFGTESVAGNGKSRTTKKSTSSGGWKSEESVADAQKPAVGGESDIARKVIDKTVDQFAAMFSGSRSQNGAPPATAPDADEWTAASQDANKSGGRRGVPVRTASNGRELGAALETPTGLKEDKFFSGDNSAPLVTNLQSVPASELVESSAVVPAAPVVREKSNGKTAAGGVKVPSTFNFRNLVLIVGGIIVAALLFAPGRKKPTEVKQVPAQG